MFYASCDRVFLLCCWLCHQLWNNWVFKHCVTKFHERPCFWWWIVQGIMYGWDAMIEHMWARNQCFNTCSPSEFFYTFFFFLKDPLESKRKHMRSVEQPAKHGVKRIKRQEDHFENRLGDDWGIKTRQRRCVGLDSSSMSRSECGSLRRMRS